MAIQVTVNYLAVLVAAVASMVIGFLWYGPLFGKMWMQLMNIDMLANRKAISEHARKPKVFDKKKIDEAKKKGMGKTYVLAFLAALVTSYVLALFVDYVEAKTIMDGVVLGFWVWIGFFATTQLGMVLWENKPMKLYLLNTLHYLVALAVMAAILAVWV